MKHWKKYIQRHQAYNQYATPVGFNYGMVVVIPCFDEPDLLTTLKSLMQCGATQNPVGVVVVVNSSELTSEAIVESNRVTYDKVIEFAKKNNQPQLSFHALLCEDMPRKHAGVGLARKTGMEWAVRGFLQSGNSEGVIISLDADCTVSENYLQLIEHQFTTYSPNCCVLNFKHRTKEDNPVLQSAIDQYEDYIWYFRNALKAIDFPFYYHTIGSAFAVSADAYVRTGGIGRQQGGEDFYFLQKVFFLERTTELMKAFVYPEARFSDRIPFGTGPALENILATDDNVLRVYSVEAFKVLKSFFIMRIKFYKQPDKVVSALIESLHISIQHYIKENNLLTAITDCNQNSATAITFQKRFFHHFDAFFIIKYLNFAHSNYFELIPIDVAKDKLDTLL
ncbi:MAG: hypothetical protein GX921_05960 [Bacteroidales bacterium]|nr:hypothetical protein [Bacteroidales bacterium]